MRVLFIIPHTFISGAAIQLRNLLDYLPPDYECTVFVTNYDGMLENDIRRRARLISVTRLDEDKRRQIIRRDLANDYDILHVIESWDGYHVLPYFEGKKIVTLYGNYKRKDGYFKKRINYLESLDEKPVMVTDNPRNLGVLPGIRLIRTGIEQPDPVFTVVRNPRKIIWVGRNSDEKRLHVYLDIAKRFEDAEDAVAFVAVISGVQLGTPLPSNVEVFYNVRHRIELEYLYKSSSLILNTSKHEGTPQSLIEGMSCGCIPIAPNTGGIPDLVGNTGSILNVSSRGKDHDKVVDLYTKVVTEHLNITITEEQRKAVRDRVRNDTVERMVRDWEAIYENNEIRA